LNWPEDEIVFLPDAPGVDWEFVERRRQAAAPQTPADWRVFLETLLTPQPCVFHRNLEISAFYAALYLRHPGRYKWAAMAALASRHVRTALLPYHLPADRGGFVSPEAEEQSLKRLHMGDLSLIRDTNNAIFRDIAWFHLAYDVDSDRAKRLSLHLNDEMRSQLGLMEKAQQASQAGDDNLAHSLTWQANIEILRHEQVDMVQPRFDQLSPGFARWLSLGATMSYQHSGENASRDRLGSFYLFMLSRRLPLLLRSRSLPRMTRLDHRWEWIENRLVGQFQAYEERDDDHLKAQFSKIFKELSKLYEKKVCTLPHAF